MEFRANFILGLIRLVLWMSVFVFQIEIVFHNTSSLGGWGKADILIILALSRLVEGIIDTLFAFNIGDLPNSVQTGEFDYHLTRPLPTQLYISFRRFAIYHIGNIITGLALLIYALTIRESLPPFKAWIYLIILITTGMLIFYSLLIIISSFVFFVDRLSHIYGFHSIITEPLTVPFSLFPFGARFALTFLLPIAFIVYIPASALTGRLETWHIPAAIAMATIFLFLSTMIWRTGLRRYSSASS